MSNSTHAHRDDLGNVRSAQYVHLCGQTAVEAILSRNEHIRPLGPYVVVHLGGPDDAAVVTLFVYDAGLLDRLISTLADARAALVAELVDATDIPKAG